MKKLTYLLFLAIGVTACSVESIDSTENLVVADAKANLKNQVSTSAHTTPLSSYTFFSGNSVNEKAKLTVSNTCDVITLNFTPLNDEPIVVKFDIFKTLPAVDVNPGNGKITLPNGTISSNEANLDSDGNYSISFSDLGVTDADNVFIFARMGNEDAGSQVLGDWEYFTYDVTAEDCCEERFTYFDNNDGTYTFTYTVGEDMDDAELVFTFAQGAYVSGLSADFSQNGNGQTYKATMDLEKCDVLEYTVTLTPTCSGSGNKTSNVWTDFKVNDVSQKADPEDKFTGTCN